jgi:hypothetical protein
VLDVARDQDKIVNERGGRDLLVERVLRMRHPQTAPNLGRIRVKSKNTVAELDDASLKKATTPGFAVSFLRNSLITSVSTRYTLRLGGILDTFEVLVLPYVRNCSQHFCQAPLAGAAQRASQNLSMLAFGTAGMFRRSLLERLH